jgi:LysM repeat protein
MGDSFIFDDGESGQSSFTDMPEGDTPDGGDDGSPEGSNNRTFLIAAGILGGVILLALICMAAYAFLLLPRQKAAQTAGQAAVLLTNTAIAGGATSTAQALMATATLDSGSIAATAQAVAATRQVEAIMTASAIAAAASPTPVVVQATATPILVDMPPGTKFFYTIQPGDTLEMIASKFNSTVEAILALQENKDAGITDNSTISTGGTIVIPVNIAALTPGPVTQTVAALYTQAAQAELTAATTPVFAKIKASSGNNITVYVDPNGATLGSLTNGVQVEVLPEQQDINGVTWVKIRYTNAQGQTVEGWVDQSQLIPVAGAVPTTGFADEVGLPGLFILGIVLVVIILLSRRLRSTPKAS